TIAVVEAGVVGENASGRNSGFAIDLPHAPESSPASLGKGRDAIRVNRFAIAELDRLIGAHGIDCGWRQDGRYHAAVTSEGADRSL
ncbi:FAD-dependent oxidoreductase, partial [Acinetobacter baumannii]